MTSSGKGSMKDFNDKLIRASRTTTFSTCNGKGVVSARGRKREGNLNTKRNTITALEKGCNHEPAVLIVIKTLQWYLIHKNLLQKSNSDKITISNSMSITKRMRLDHATTSSSSLSLIFDNSNNNNCITSFARTHKIAYDMDSKCELPSMRWTIYCSLSRQFITHYHVPFFVNNTLVDLLLFFDLLLKRRSSSTTQLSICNPFLSCNSNMVFNQSIWKTQY